VFLDLTDKGFLRSESETDILSVNNKCALGFREKDLLEILLMRVSELDLPQAIKSWINV
jgi:protein-arginine kinase